MATACAARSGPTPITIALFDPELNEAYGTGVPYAIDEVRDASGTHTGNIADADNARFQLLDPLGGVMVP